MSSVGGSGAGERANKNDELRRTREEYESRESNQVKKQKKEVRRLNSKHSEEVAQLKEQYETRLGGVQAKSRETISKRDENNKQQVDQIREMYHEQLRRKSEDAETDQSVLRKTMGSEIAKNKLISSGQRNEMERNFRDALGEKDREYSSLSENAREEVKISLDERTNRLNKKHEKELEALSTDRDRKIIEMQNASGNQKSYLQSRIKELERRIGNEKTKIEDNWRSIVNNQATMHDTILTNRNELLAAEKGALRDDYRLRTDILTQKNEEFRENLKSEADERMDRQVRSARNEVREMRGEKVQSDLTTNRLKKVEKDNLVRAYEDRMRDLNYQKDETHTLAHDQASKRIGNILDRSEKILSESNRRNRNAQGTQHIQAQEDRQNLIRAAKESTDAQRTRSETMIGRISNNTKAELKNQEGFYQKNVEQMKDNYSDQLIAQREAQLETLNKIRSDMEGKLRSSETKSQNKIENLVKGYEEKIRNLNDSHTQEIARMKENFEGRAQQRDKGHDLESAQIGQKYQVRMAQQQEEHQKEIDKVQRRHEQSLADITQKMSYLNKKA